MVTAFHCHWHRYCSKTAALEVIVTASFAGTGPLANVAVGFEVETVVASAAEHGCCAVAISTVVTIVITLMGGEAFGIAAEEVFVA